MKKTVPNLNYRESGAGPPLLLIHGLFDSLESWQKLTPLLTPRYKVYAIDLPAFGKSPLPSRWEASITEMIEAVTDFLDKKGLGPITLLGSSMGGGLALGIAGKLRERVGRIVLINPYSLPCLPAAAKAAQSGFMGKILPYILGRAGLRRCAKAILTRSIHNSKIITPPLIERVIAPFSSLQGRKNLFRFLQGITADEIQMIDALLPGLTHPVLIIWGEKDGWLQDSHWERLRERLQNVNVIKIPNCGHLPHMEKPKEVAIATTQFLDSSV